ncbi:MAG TPA: prolyl oligopeptidase family serine peptidase [Hyphomonadaceae bacterium]|jgi:dipeptidyl aminopeptidase/acylaminoacyl peptidase|nr:prolyl oligopeptidase family serine peptidase [Hyphomonadaceae bacterium]
MRQNLVVAALFAVVLAACTAFAPAPAPFPATPVSFPDYSAYDGIEHYATPEAYAQARADTRFVMERIAYPSDGLEVYAYLYRPATTPTAPMPVIVFNRGSYTREDFAPEVLMPGRRLAEAGFLVIAPMYRGSGGAGGHDAFGGEDLRDIFNLMPVIKSLPYADVSRVFLYGESRGGVMALMALRDGFPARAAAVYGAITDMAPLIAEGGIYRGLGPTVWPGFPANEAETGETRSAIRWADRINAPLLIMHGGADEDVAPANAIALADKLKALGKPYQLKIFEGETHVIPGKAAERDADAIAWFRVHDSTGSN